MGIYKCNRTYAPPCRVNILVCTRVPYKKVLLNVYIFIPSISDLYKTKDPAFHNTIMTRLYWSPFVKSCTLTGQMNKHVRIWYSVEFMQKWCLIRSRIIVVIYGVPWNMHCICCRIMYVPFITAVVVKLICIAHTTIPLQLLMKNLCSPLFSDEKFGIVSIELVELELSGRFHFPSILIERVISCTTDGINNSLSPGYTNE